MRAQMIAGVRETHRVPDGVTDQQRQRVATALTDFWYGGAGPSHSEIDSVLVQFELQGVTGSKRERIRAALMSCGEAMFSELAEQLTTLLRRSELPAADQMMLRRLRSALNDVGLEINELYEVVSLRSGTHLPELAGVPALREHIGRIERALRDEDRPQLLGSTKELLESTAKVVLTSRGQEPPSRFPALLSAALEELGLHPRQANASEELEQSLRKILGGALSIALGIDEYRNSHGTGHGRGDATAFISDADARLAVSTGAALAAWMLDSLDASPPQA